MLQTPPMNIFAGIENAKIMNRANYINKPGKYWLRINLCKYFTNRKGENRLAVEFTVVKVVDTANGQAHALGEEVTHVIKPGDYFMSEVKNFLCTALEAGESEIKAEDAMLAFTPAANGQEQPLTRSVLETEAFNKMSKEKNQLYTVIAYKRLVHPGEMLEALPQADRDRFFPGQELEKMIAAMKAA